MDLSTEVTWSAESYKLEDLKTGECPLLLKVARGLYGTTEDRTITADQMVLLHKWEVSERVVAVNREGLWLTIPTDHKHKLQVINKKNSFEKLGPYIIQEVIKRFKPPVKARFDPSVRAEFYIQNKLHNSKDFGFFELTSVYYMDYGKASIISADGKINRHRISILPMNVEAEFYIGISMSNYSDNYFFNLLREISRSSGPLVNDNSNVYGFSGITECDDTMTQTLSRPTAKSRAEPSKTWGRREGSMLNLSVSAEPPKDNPTPIRRQTMPDITEPLSLNKDKVGDSMAIYANYEVATMPTKKKSDHTDTERRRSESFEPVPIYENLEGLRRAQKEAEGAKKEAEGIRYNDKDDGIGNSHRSDLNKADSSSRESLQDYEHMDPAGGHGSVCSLTSEEDYCNYSAGASSSFTPTHQPAVHKWQEDAKNHADSTDDIYENQDTASLIRNREPSGIERQRSNDDNNNAPQDYQLEPDDAIYQNQVTPSLLLRALSDRRRQQRDIDDSSDGKEADHYDSSDAIYQNQVTCSSASINKVPVPAPRTRKDQSGTQGRQGDNNPLGGMNEDSPDSLYQNQEQISASLSDISGLPPPAHRLQGGGQYINAPGVDSSDGSLRSIPRYRPSDLIKGPLTARRSEREPDGQSTISSRSSTLSSRSSTMSSRSSDYTKFWHTNDAEDDSLTQGSDGVKHPILPPKDYDSKGKDRKRDDSQPILPSKDYTSNGKDSKRNDSQPILPSKDYSSKGKDSKRDDFQPSLPSKDYTSKEKDSKSDDSQPSLPQKDYSSKGKDSLPSSRNSDVSSSAVQPGNKVSVSAPQLPPRDPTPSMAGSIGKTPSMAGSIGKTPSMAGSIGKTPSMAGSIGKTSPSIESMPMEKAPLSPKLSRGYKTQTFHNLKDIPENISNLGVSEIADCLALLKLAEFIEPFAAGEVDGQLLKNFTRENLVEDFGMGSVSANKVLLLINGTVQSVGGGPKRS